jgi:hypothetical protein
MKRMVLTGMIIAIAMSFAAAFPVNGNMQFANLTLTTSQAGQYLFEINGYSYQVQHNTLQLNQLQQGMYSVRIMRWRRTFGHQGFWDAVYQGAIQVPAASNVHGIWNPWTGLQLQVTPLYAQHPGMMHPGHQNPGMGHPQMGHPQMGHPHMGHPHMNPGMNQGMHGNMMGMHPNTFQGFMHQLRSASFDNNKVNLAKTAIRNNGISVVQLQQVLREFSFDSNRLDVAKFAYPYTVDRNNYFMLHSSFDFESNAQHLMSSIH